MARPMKYDNKEKGYGDIPIVGNAPRRVPLKGTETVKVRHYYDHEKEYSIITIVEGDKKIEIKEEDFEVFFDEIKEAERFLTSYSFGELITNENGEEALDLHYFEGEDAKVIREMNESLPDKRADAPEQYERFWEEVRKRGNNG